MLRIALLGLISVVVFGLAPPLYAQLAGSVPINWDPGTAEAGTERASSTGLVSGDFLFRITPEIPSTGAWRTILQVAEGQADLYLRRSGYPNPSEPASVTRRALRGGSDDEAIILQSTDFGEGQEWYILVRCVEAQWTLFSGEIFVRDLGELGFDDSNTNDVYEPSETPIPNTTEELVIGPEGTLFFRTEVPDGTPAWSLSASDATTYIHVRKSLAALSNKYDLRAQERLLVVPNYLQASSAGAAYFVSVVGPPGTSVSLTSAIHTYENADYLSTNSVSATTGGFHTFQFQVPPNQIAWEVQLVPTEGNPNFALRRDQVPSPLENDAVSESLELVPDSITLSPSSSGGFGLSNGTFYVTIYSTGPYTAELISGEVTVEPLAFEGEVVNTFPDKTGWHYYILDDLDSQLGLGWELSLTDHQPGTEIAIRRNAIPSRWKYRSNNSTSLRTSSGLLDRSVIGDILQLPRHQKDVWYVGIYLPEQALGPFKLTTNKISAPAVAFNGSDFLQSAHAHGVLRYYRVDVPFDVQGWNLVVDQVKDAEGLGRDPYCAIAIAKDVLPTMSNDELFKGPTMTREGTTWASGGTWSLGAEWTEVPFDNDGGRRFSQLMPMGRPLSGGTYYIAINPLFGPVTYRIRNQGIGYGDAWQLPIHEMSLPEIGNDYRLPSLPLGELHIVKMSIPDGHSSLTIELKTLDGDALMAVKRGGIPSVIASPGRLPDNVTGGLYRSTGDEFLTLLPEPGNDAVLPADYFFVVMSQGKLPPDPSDAEAPLLPRLPAEITLANTGPLNVVSLGEIPLEGINHPIAVKGARLLPIDFTIPSDNIVAVQITSTLVKGAGTISWWQGPSVRTPAPFKSGSDNYGYFGGENGSTRNDDEIASRFYKGTLLTTPIYSTETIGATFRVMIRANAGTDLEGSFNITLFGSEDLPFDSPTPFTVANQFKNEWRYFEIDVPADGPIAWAIDIESIIDIDSDASKNGYVTATLRRDQAPPGQTSISNSSTTWASGLQHVFGIDWSNKTYNPDGSRQLSAILPFGKPLQPGKYLLGLRAVDGDVSYKVRTRGIGTGFQIPVTDVPYGDGFTITDLPPRAIAYYRINVPAGTPNWRLESRTLLPGQDVSLALSSNGFVSTFSSSTRDSSALHGTVISRADFPSETDFEEHLVLPKDGLTLEETTFYLGVLSHGSNATADTIGSDPVTVTVDQPSPLPITDLGTFVYGDEGNTSFTLPPGGTGLFKLTVPEANVDGGGGVYIETTSGTLGVNRLGGAKEGIPRPAIVNGTPDYGITGGQSGIATTYTGVCQRLGVGTHYFSVRAIKHDSARWHSASGFLGMTPCTDISKMEASKGETFGGLSKGAWTFRRITIPEGPDAWELLIDGWRYDTAENLQPGDINVVISRDVLPSGTAGSLGQTSTAFEPGGSYWVNQSADWTRLDRDSDNAKRIWSVIPMGAPLEPAEYIVGIYAKTSDVYYYMRSCLIGNEFDVPITELAFTGENAITPPLTAASKSALYYKVTVPSGIRSWQMGLDVTRGDWSLALRHGAIPGSLARGSNKPESGHGFFIDKPGSEHLLLLPDPKPTTDPVEGEEPWSPFIKPGDYYFAVASKGAIPSSSAVGVDPSEGQLFSEGQIPIESIGSMTAAGISHALSIDGGKTIALEFTVPVAMPGVEIRLDGRTGNPQFALWTGDGSLLPQPPSSSDTYGFLGGETDPEHRFEASTIYTITNVSPGTYRFMARASVSSGSYPSAGATLTLSQKANLPLAFGPALATETVPHTHRATLSQGRKNVYEVHIPESYEAGAILGWLISFNQFQGTNTTLKVFHQDGGSNPELRVSDQNSLLVVPPWWQPNRTYYLSVEASTITDYEISSKPVEPRATWTMPEAFGQTIGTSFSELAPDVAQDLPEDDWHFYAIQIPNNNPGLLRTFLTAVSGEPDLYIREGAVPTTDHRSVSRTSGSVLYDRSVVGTGSGYGNWVDSSSRFDASLGASTWYLGVRANSNQNARYRLEATTGTANALNLEGGKVSEVNVTGGDWRYYYVDIPETPLGDWNLLFTRSQGDARLYVRDTAPPGFGANPINILNDATDAKNLYRIYQGNGFDPGFIDYPVPPLRPGSRYFLGVYASQDSTFSIESGFTERTDLTPIDLAFRNGFYQGDLPPNSELVFRVAVPFGASQWQHTSMHSSDVEVRVDQGSLPPPVGSISSPSVIPSSRTDGEVVGSANITPTGWPLIHERDYYVVASNRSETAQPFSITLNGVMPPEADDDDDGLPDIWEEQHFTSIAAYSPSDDADGDGISNLLEFALDLKPNQATSLLHESVKISVEEGRLVMTVNKAISFDTSDLIFTVEASADSEVWNTHETMILTDNPQQLIVADKVPIAEAELRFLRLTVRASP